MQIIGHRGASGLKPENTLASFQAAVAHGVDMVELDVYTLRTGEVVVIHDDTVDRTTNGTGLVMDHSFRQLRQLDAGGGEKVPLLTEVLDLVRRRMPVNIELKGPGTARPVADIIRHYITQKGWSYDLFLVSSFDHTEIRTFNRLMPLVRVGTIFDNRPSRYGTVAARDLATSAHLEANDVTPAAVREAHSRGVKVYAYTVDTKRQADRLRAMKVDGIFTDHPERVITGLRLSHT